MPDRVGAVVLAAGAGRRFGGGKLGARLEGRPILQHVLDALAAAGIDDPVVVVGEDEAALDAAMSWRAARRVRNPDPASVCRKRLWSDELKSGKRTAQPAEIDREFKKTQDTFGLPAGHN